MPFLPTAAELVQVVTTTVHESSTATPNTSSSDATPIPIGAIAGGACAGVVIAVGAVLVWTWWGKSIKKAQEKQRKEMHAALTTRANTRKNASTLSTPRAFGYMASFTPGQSDKKVKFVSIGSPEKIKATSPAAAPEISEKRPSKPTPVAPPPRHPSRRTSSSSSTSKASTSRSTPRAAPPNIEAPPVPPLRISKRSQGNGEGSKAKVLAKAKPTNDKGPSEPLRRPDNPTVLEPAPDLAPPPTVVHKASTVSSNSWYSTQSAEEHQRRVPANLILAALGHVRDARRWSGLTRTTGTTGSLYSTVTDEQGPPSSYRNPRARMSGVAQPSRLSQISSASADTPPPSDVQVGVALGGEDPEEY
ncbi:hypothetical protein PLICRDRAFT_54634 [Plicaturopsis crispa FD-325 SS-3]|nr:hypothetical protein PLICRDRAFT_54634 [Plicaturopsis crispa FD-325 SS-3]